MSGSAMYFSSAIVAALIALALLAWALFADRSRGRKRCPKCWYDMSAAVGLRCPECGHEAASEKRLLKTRRRWKVVLASALPFALAGFLAVQPKVQQDGWWSIMPTTLMLLYFQFEQDDAVMEAIDRRMKVEYEHPDFVGTYYVPDYSTLYKWQWTWLGEQLVQVLQDSELTDARLEACIKWASTVRDFTVDWDLRDRLTEAVWSHATHDNTTLRIMAALFSVDDYDPEASLARLRLLLDDDEWRVGSMAVTAIHLLAQRTHNEDAIVELIRAVSHPVSEVRHYAAGFIGRSKILMGARAPEVHAALQAAFDITDDESGEMRAKIVWAIAQYKDDGELYPFLKRMILHDDPHVRAGVLEALTTEGIGRSEFLDAIMLELQRKDATQLGRWYAAWLLHHWQDAHQLKQYEGTLRKLLDHDDDETILAAYTALRRAGFEVTRRLTADELRHAAEPSN